MDKNKHIVALTQCEEYDQFLVNNAVKEAVDLLGGMKKFVKKGERIALKVNLLMKATPDKCMTTHPAVVEAVAKLVLEAGAIPFIVDSAGGPYTENYINSIYSASGMQKVAYNLKIELNQDFGFEEVENPKAKVGFKFPVLTALQKADKIINLCKLKTHSFTGFTNAVKNMFGAIPGLTKVEMHGKYRDLDTFIDFLYDIHTYFGEKICLNITDAVYGMEGYGPSNGTPKKIGVIIAGQSAVAVDVIGAKIITLIPENTPIIKKGIERGFISSDFPILVVGENLLEHIIKDYYTIEPNNYKPYANYVPTFLQGAVHRLMTKRPVISKRKCKGCKKCFEHCPAKAISMIDYHGQKRAEIDYNKCIRCYCCQELCPFGVVKVKAGFIYKLIHLKDKKRNTK